MTTETVPGRVNVGEFSGKAFLLNVDRAERAEFYKLLEEAPWEGKTASGHWQVRDLCGHLIDVTESIHSWDIKAGLGRAEPLSDAAAVTLIPFMLIVIQYTVDVQHAGDRKSSFGIDISGPGGGKWCANVDGTAVPFTEGTTDGCATVFSFTPSDFVLNTYQRLRGGTVSGDVAMAERVRDLLFKI